MSKYSNKILKVKIYDQDEKDYEIIEQPIFYTFQQVIIPMAITTFLSAFLFFYIGMAAERNEAVKAGVADFIDGKFVYRK